MRFTRLSFTGLVGLGFVCASILAHAGEGEGGGEGGGGEGKGAAPPREQREFTEKTTKMNSLAGKIEEAAKHFEELAREKGGSREERDARRREMVEVARQREKDSTEYARVKTELAQRYPNHGEPGRAKPEAPAGASKEPASVEEAVPAGLDGILRETKATIDRTYAPFLPPKAAPEASRAPASAAPARPRLRLER